MCRFLNNSYTLFHAIILQFHQLRKKIRNFKFKFSFLFSSDGPTVNLIPEKEVSLAESLAVKCNVASYPPPQTIEWFKENDPFFRQNGDTLRLDSVSSDDAGRYICKATVIARPSGSSMQRESTSNSSILIHIRRKCLL